MRHSAFLFCILTVIGLFLFKQVADGITMSDGTFILQFGTLETASGVSSGTNKRITISVGQLAPGLSTGTHYQIKSGFSYVRSIIPFSFKIDNIFINFGTLSPTFPQTRTNTLTVGNGSANGYQVLGYEDHQLYGPNFSFIPNTTCDAGTCTTSVASVWSSNTTYGFGYNCQDTSSPTRCGSGFTNSTYYKQFADLTRNQMPQAVMKATTANVATSSANVTITYQVNINSNQAAGSYNNHIFYVATPSY